MAKLAKNDKKWQKMAGMAKNGGGGQKKQKKGFFDSFMDSFFSFVKDDDKFYEEMKKLTRFVIYNKNGFIPITTNSILKIN